MSWTLAVRPSSSVRRHVDDLRTAADMTGLSIAASAVDLYWLPLGAGDHVVKHCGRWYEAAVAAREHRDRRDLCHAALEVHLDGDR